MSVGKVVGLGIDVGVGAVVVHANATMLSEVAIRSAGIKAVNLRCIPKT